MSENLYKDFLKEILEQGVQKEDRTNTGTVSKFRPKTMYFDLNDGETFPLFTCKKISFSNILKELLWFISGSTNINDLDSKIWNEWADEKGDIGKMYGYQLRRIENLEMSFSKNDNKISFENKKYDPLKDTIENIKNNPNSRRHVISLWNHLDLPNEKLSPQENVKNGKSALANCHGTVIQFYVENGKISLAHYQRSLDAFLGGFYNIASYSLLLLMVARITNLKAHQLIFDAGDAHIYNNHIPQVKEYLQRDILSDLPSVKIINQRDNIDEFLFEDFELVNYKPQETITAKIAI